MDILAFDVSKDKLDLFDGTGHRQIPNRRSDIAKLLSSRKGAAVVCEPTGRFHIELAEEAFRKGSAVYLVNPREARSFKESLSFRAKTDELDARYLYEYAKRNGDLLRPFKPASPRLKELKELLGKRQAAVEARTALAQSFGSKLSAAEKALFEAFGQTIGEMERKLDAIASEFESYERLRTVPGVGPISGCALLYVLETMPFESSDALVAFLGLDVRIRQSGKSRGLRKLSKRGDPVLRHLACMAGRGLFTSKLGQPKKAELAAKGRQFPERLAIGARKVLRTAFAVFHQKTEFDRKRWRWA